VFVGLRITTAYRALKKKTVQVAFKGSPAASVGIGNGLEGPQFDSCQRQEIFLFSKNLQTSVASWRFLFYWYRWSLPWGKEGVA
jgi:hypothetical protein